MDMAKVKLQQLSQHGALLDRYGASVRVLGRRDLLKEDVLEAIDKAVDLTKHNERAILNICFPYTSRAEITTSIQTIVEEYSKPLPEPTRAFSETGIAQKILKERNSVGASQRSPSIAASASPQVSVEADRSSSVSSSSTTSLSDQDELPATSSSSSTTLHADFLTTLSTMTNTTGLPDPETITANTITSHLYTGTNPPLDLLVRTSGVERLSDFMLWQCHDGTEIVFLDCLWPEFDMWTFLPVLVEWQWRARRKQGAIPPASGNTSGTKLDSKAHLKKTPSIRREKAA
jgi:ditrans,polycis-polyprenyl diphosphate synthase